MLIGNRMCSIEWRYSSDIEWP